MTFFTIQCRAPGCSEPIFWRRGLYASEGDWEPNDPTLYPSLLAAEIERELFVAPVYGVEGISVEPVRIPAIE